MSQTPQLMAGPDTFDAQYGLILLRQRCHHEYVMSRVGNNRYMRGFGTQQACFQISDG